MERDAGLEGVKDDDDGSTYHSNNNNNNKRTEGSGGCGRKRHWVWAFAMYASSTIRSTMGFTTPRVVGSRWYPRARSVSTTGGYQKTRFQQQQQQQQQQHDSVVASSSSSSWEPLTTTDAAMWMPNDCWTNYLDVQLPEGRCVGVQLLNPDPEHPDALTPENMARPSHWIHAMFHPQEVAYAVSQPKAHGRDSFLVGRLAMREALRRHDPATTPTCSILKDEYGRPLVPHGYLGSISHKQNIGVALVMTTNDSSDANSDDNMLGIGVDIERTQVRRMKIASKVLTPKEMGELGRVEGVTSEEEVLLRFSMKESLYKAMHPLICQYVGFQEAEVTPRADGTATVDWHIKNGKHVLFEDVSLHWRRLDDGDHFLTSARITLVSEGCDVPPEALESSQ